MDFWSSASVHEIREKSRDISRWVTAAPVRKIFSIPQPDSTRLLIDPCTN